MNTSPSVQITQRDNQDAFTAIILTLHITPLHSYAKQGSDGRKASVNTFPNTETVKILPYDIFSPFQV